jgi:hypothetical protein
VAGGAGLVDTCVQAGLRGDLAGYLGVAVHTEVSLDPFERLVALGAVLFKFCMRMVSCEHNL